MKNKVSKQEFLDFLKKEGIAFISGSNGERTINIIKIPFNDKFDYLFKQDSIGEGISLFQENFEYIGIHYRPKNQLYDFYDYRFQNFFECPEIIVPHSGSRELFQDMYKKVATRIEKMINAGELVLDKPLTDRRMIKNLETYLKSDVYDQAYRYVINNKTSKYVCFTIDRGFYQDYFDDVLEYLNYIENPESIIQDYIDIVMNERYDQVYYEYKICEALRREIDNIYSDPNCRVNKIKTLKDICDKLNAKNVFVTTNKDVVLKVTVSKIFYNPDYILADIYGNGKIISDTRFNFDEIKEVKYRGKVIYTNS